MWKTVWTCHQKSQGVTYLWRGYSLPFWKKTWEIRFPSKQNLIQSENSTFFLNLFGSCQETCIWFKGVMPLYLPTSISAETADEDVYIHLHTAKLSGQTMTFLTSQVFQFLESTHAKTHLLLCSLPDCVMPAAH